MNQTEIRSMADVEALEKSLNFDDLMPFETTYDAIKAGAQKDPSKTAISFFLSGAEYENHTDISYRELLAKINQSANFFHCLGLKSDDVIAFILPNLPETHYVIWGGEAACQVLAINPLLEAAQIRDLINAANAKAVVTMNPFTNIDLWPKLESIIEDLDTVEYAIGVDIAHHIGGIKGIAAKAIQALNKRKISTPSWMNYLDFRTAINKENAKQLDFYRPTSEHTVSSLFCTGGTTGLPKIARRTHRNELANAASVKLANQKELAQDKVILAGLPLFHVNGALVTGLIPFSLGATIVIATPQGYRGDKVIENFWDIAEHFKVNAFSAVPTVYSALMNYPTEGKDLSSLELGICGAAPMPVETFKSFQEKTGVKILEGYGCTEGTCVSSLNPFHGEQKIGSIGLRIPFQEMKSVILEDNNIVRDCEINEIGALVISGPNVFLGYQIEDQNKGIWVTDEAGNRWLNTGDLARKDEEGYFWLTGRKKELIVRGGHNIEPKMIEEAMCRHPAINMAAAVGKPDRHAGEVPVCYIQVDNNSSLTEAELLEFATQEIPERAAIPKAVHIVEELPLTAVGKVFKPALEMQEIESCVADIAAKELPGASIAIEVTQDPKFGIIADIDLSDSDQATKDKFAKLLSEYTFKSRIA